MARVHSTAQKSHRCSQNAKRGLPHVVGLRVPAVPASNGQKDEAEVAEVIEGILTSVEAEAAGQASIIVTDTIGGP